MEELHTVLAFSRVQSQDRGWIGPHRQGACTLGGQAPAASGASPIPTAAAAAWRHGMPPSRAAAVHRTGIEHPRHDEESEEAMGLLSFNDLIARKKIKTPFGYYEDIDDNQ